MLLRKIKATTILIQFVITVSCVIVLMYLFKKYNWQIRRAWAKMQTKLIGFKIVSKGKIDPNAKLLIINHQSLLDIIVVENLYPKNIAWVAKKEIADMFFFGHIVKVTDMIIVKREDRKSLVKLLKDVKDKIDKGRVVAIFPEGTRGDGEKLLNFKAGAKIISEKLDLKVQPIVLTNTRNIVDSQNFVANKGVVCVEFLDSIDPKKDKQWYQKTKTDMQEALNRLSSNNQS